MVRVIYLSEKYVEAIFRNYQKMLTVNRCFIKCSGSWTWETDWSLFSKWTHETSVVDITLVAENTKPSHLKIIFFVLN